MEKKLIKEILKLKQYYQTNDLEDCIKEILHQELGRKALQNTTMSPSEYARYLSNLIMQQIKN